MIRRCLSHPRFEGATAAVFLAVLATPFVLGYREQTAEWVFAGIFRLAEDNNSYMAWAKQAQEGFFLFQNLYTTEFQTPYIFLPFFWFVGGVARWSGLSLPVVMNVAHLAGVVFFLWALRRWLALFDMPAHTRGLAFWLVLFSSGFGAVLEYAARVWPWMSLLARFPTGSPGILGTADMWTFDFITFSSMSHYPWSGIALGLVLLGWHDLARGSALRGSLWTLLTFFVHPYDGLIAAGLAWVFVVMGTRPRRVVWRDLSVFYVLVFLAVVLGSVLAAVNPVLSAYAKRLRSFDVPLISYILGLGPIFVLALAGLSAFSRAKGVRFLPLAVWAAGGFAALALPISFRHKLVHGLHIPFAVLAAVGTFWVVEKCRGSRRRIIRVLVAFFLLVGVFTNARLWNENIENVRRHWLPFYLPAPLVDALAHLDETTEPYDVVLTSSRLGIFIPPWTGCKTYAGHWDQTLDFSQKEVEIENWLQQGPSPAFQSFLSNRQIDHLLLSPPYWQGDPARWDAAAFLRRKFDNGYYRVYEVL